LIYIAAAGGLPAEMKCRRVTAGLIFYPREGVVCPG